MTHEPLLRGMPESLPPPAVEISFDNGHGEYTILGEDATTWFVVGVHGSDLLTAFSGILSREPDGYAFQEHRPELVSRFAGEDDWRIALGLLFASERAGERQRLAHPDQE